MPIILYTQLITHKIVNSKEDLVKWKIPLKFTSFLLKLEFPNSMQFHIVNSKVYFQKTQPDFYQALSL